MWSPASERPAMRPISVRREIVPLLIAKPVLRSSLYAIFFSIAYRIQITSKVLEQRLPAQRTL